MFKKLKSLKASLMLLSLSAVVLAMVILAVTMGFYTRSYYYDRVYDRLSEIASSFDTLALSTDAEFSENAKQALQSFSYKDMVEVQIFDRTGKLAAATSGDKDSLLRPDYDAAMETGRLGKSEYALESGEHVVACTEILSDFGNGSMGAVRCITSATGINRQVTLVVMLIAAIAMIIIFLCFLFCSYYARAIIRPIHDISDAAKQIAAGDLKQRIKPASLDELAELVNNINFMAEELESSEKMKNEFISSVSHELRTPLTAIKGWSETVRMARDGDKALMDKGIGIIIGETERLSGLVEELLDFSRLQSGRMTFKEENMDILAELSDVVYMYRKAAAEKHVTLTYNEPVSITTVRGDIARIKQVFINIVDNAIKYNRPGGTVLVEAKQENDRIQIKVADTGLGIKSEDVSKVKEKFYRSQTNPSIHGSGIGLAVADEIVKHHGGKLEVISEENVGTTITITLPTVSSYQTVDL